MFETTTEAATETTTEEGDRDISTLAPVMTSVEDDREDSTLTPDMGREGLSVLSVETRESSEKTNNSLPVFTSSYSPPAPAPQHNQTENIFDYNGNEMDVTMIVVESEMGERVSDMMFMFDCVKAYNAEMSVSETQTVLQCKMFDRENGENVFIVVEKNILSP